MVSAECELVRAIVNEAERVAASSTGRSAVEIAAQLAVAGWRPPCPLTREAREIVASYYETKSEPDTVRANQARRGVLDTAAEMRQAKAAMARAFALSAEWIDRQPGLQRTGVRLLAVMTGEGAA